MGMRSCGLVGAILLVLCLHAQPPRQPYVEQPRASLLAAIKTDAARRQFLLDEHITVTPPLIDAFQHEGNILYGKADFAAALGVFQFSLSLAREIGDGVLECRALFHIAGALKAEGELEQASEYYRQSLELATKLEQKDVITAALNNQAMVLRDIGNYTGAVDSGRQALAVAEDLGIRERVGHALNTLGTTYRLMGDYRLALDCFDRTYRITQEIHDQTGAAALLHNIGSIHADQGNYELALDYLLKSIDLKEKSGERWQLVNGLRSLGGAYRDAGNMAKAAQFLERALQLAESTSDKRGAAGALLDLASVDRAKSEPVKAVEHIQAALALFTTMGQRMKVARSLAELAAVHNSTGDYAGAAEAAEKAATLAREMGDPEVLWRASSEAGRANRKLGKLQEARVQLDDAIATIESLREHVAGNDEERQRFFEDKVAPYHEMVRISVQSNRTEEGLAFAERAKARVLLEILQSGRASVTRAMTPEERTTELSLRQRIAALNGRLAQDDRASLKVRRDGLVREYGAFESALYAAHPDLRADRMEMEAPAAADVAALLPDARSALLEYVVTETETFLFVVTKRAPHLRVFRIPVSRRTLAQRTRAFYDRIASRNLDIRTEAAATYKLLLGPVAALLAGMRTLIIVPDGPLWQLPFHALAPGGDTYLIERFDVVYTPSAAVLARIHQRASHPRSAGRRILAMSYGVPGADAEARAIVELYGPGRSRLYAGDAAEDAFKREAGQYDIVHIAAHGVLDDRNPMYSYVALAASHGEDGMLEAREMMNLDLKARLVVLSACETGRGKIRAGEGVMGMTWAMFAAGAPVTVASNWKIDSASAVPLMSAFHSGLRAGLSPATALRRAASKLMSSPEYRHPFYWASFSVFGSGFEPL